MAIKTIPLEARIKGYIEKIEPAPGAYRRHVTTMFEPTTEDGIIKKLEMEIPVASGSYAYLDEFLKQLRDGEEINFNGQLTYRTQWFGRRLVANIQGKPAEVPSPNTFYRICGEITLGDSKYKIAYFNGKLVGPLFSISKI